jgi:hypothetical protein
MTMEISLNQQCLFKFVLKYVVNFLPKNLHVDTAGVNEFIKNNNKR